MNPEDFAAVADELLKGSTAAHCRTAIGRAYYSTFTLAFLLLAKDIRFPKTADKHTKVRHYLENCGHPKMNDVARGLDDLRQMRTKADYDMQEKSVEDHSLAALQVARVKMLNADLKSMLNGPGRTKIIAEIAAYRKKINDF